MTTNNIQNLASFLQALPVVTPFSTQQLLAQKASHDKIRFGSEVSESHTIRATRLTVILKEIPGYEHSGLNE